MELDFEEYNYEGNRDGDGNIVFNNGPYRSVVIKNNTENGNGVKSIQKEDIIGDNTVINVGGPGKGKTIVEDIDVNDYRINIRKGPNGTLVKTYETQSAKANGSKDISEELPLVNNTILTSNNELIDRVYLNIDPNVFEINAPTNGSSMNEVDAGPPVIGDDESGDENEESVPMSEIEEYKTVQTSANFGYNNNNQYVTNVAITPSSGRVAMKRAYANVIAKEDNNYQMSITSNGNYPIEVPENKDFIIGGNVSVNVSTDTSNYTNNNDIMNYVQYQNSPYFNWNSQNQYVSSHTVLPSNGRVAMKKAYVNIIANPETNYTLNIDSNGSKNIVVPQGKDFIVGGTINVDVTPDYTGYTANSDIEDFKTVFQSMRNISFNDVSVYGHMGTFSIPCSSSKQAMKVVNVNFTTRPEQRTVNYTSNGTRTLVPGSDYDYLSEVVVKVNVKPGINYIVYNRNYNSNSSDNLMNANASFQNLYNGGDPGSDGWRKSNISSSGLYTLSSILPGKARIHVIRYENTNNNKFYYVFMVVSSISSSVGGPQGQQGFDYFAETRTKKLEDGDYYSGDCYFFKDVDFVIDEVALCRTANSDDFVSGVLKNMNNSVYKIFESSPLRQDLYNIGCFSWVN